MCVCVCVWPLCQAVGDCVQLGLEDNKGTLGPKVPRVMYLGQPPEPLHNHTLNPKKPGTDGAFSNCTVCACVRVCVRVCVCVCLCVSMYVSHE